MRNTSLSPRLTSILYLHAVPTPRLSFPPTCDNAGSKPKIISKWTRPFSTMILLWGVRRDCGPVLGRVLRRVYASGWTATGAEGRVVIRSSVIVC
jgi:hypothetical protein